MSDRNETVDAYRYSDIIMSAMASQITSISTVSSAQRPVTRSFDVSFDLRLNKRLSKQS